MKKFKIGLHLNVSLLEDLHNKKTSGVVIQKSRHHILLHPIHLKNVGESIKEILNVGISKFDKKLGGILLGFKNIKLLNDNGIIHNDSNGIHIDIEGDFFIFKPTLGREMKGVVSREGKDFLAVLVYNTFNVSLPKDQDENNCDLDVHVGDEVLFEIVHIDTSLHIPFIRGELKSVISKSEIAIQHILPKKEKSSKITFEENVIEQEEVTHIINSKEDGEFLTGKPKKHKKKDKIINCGTPEQEEKKMTHKLSKKLKKRSLSESSVFENDDHIKKSKKKRKNS